MRILFYNRNYENLGIEFIASYLKSKGHIVELIFDPGFSENPYFNIPFLPFPKDNIMKKKMLNKIKKFKPDIAMFSATTYGYPFAREMALLIKRELKIPTLIGGVHATMLPDQVIKEEAFDMVCVGEGELAVAELADRMERGVDYKNVENIWVKDKGKIYKNKVRRLVDLNILSNPDKDLFYKYGCFKDTVYVMAGRGCPYNCTYCFNHSFKKLYSGKGTYVRFRHPKKVIEELKGYIRKYKIKNVAFEDDTFTLNPIWLKEFLELYIKEIRLPYRCLVRANTINLGIAKLLKKSGCEWAHMGLESGDQNLSNNLLKRGLTNEQIINAAKLLKKEKIKIKLFVIFGFPDEGPNEMFNTVAVVDKIRPDAVCSYTFMPYPKTQLNEYSYKKGLISKEIFERIDKGQMSIHSGSMLKHPYKDLANNIKVVIPLYNRAPFPFKSFFRSMMTNKKQNKILMKLLYFMSIPFYSGGELIPKIKENINMMIKTKEAYNAE